MRTGMLPKITERCCNWLAAVSTSLHNRKRSQTALTGWKSRQNTAQQVRSVTAEISRSSLVAPNTSSSRGQPGLATSFLFSCSYAPGESAGRSYFAEVVAIYEYVHSRYSIVAVRTHAERDMSNSKRQGVRRLARQGVISMELTYTRAVGSAFGSTPIWIARWTIHRVGCRPSLRDRRFDGCLRLTMARNRVQRQC